MNSYFGTKKIVNRTPEFPSECLKEYNKKTSQFEYKTNVELHDELHDQLYSYLGNDYISFVSINSKLQYIYTEINKGNDITNFLIKGKYNEVTGIFLSESSIEYIYIYNQLLPQTNLDIESTINLENNAMKDDKIQDDDKIQFKSRLYIKEKKVDIGTGWLLYNDGKGNDVSEDYTFENGRWYCMNQKSKKSINMIVQDQKQYVDMQQELSTTQKELEKVKKELEKVKKQNQSKLLFCC